MSEDLIRYDILTQEALRGVIRKVLEEVVVAGLPGEHHFFITFDTTHPGVRLSDRMRERYPESMTIVIQHTFWDLKTSETGFELDLTFNDIRERLRIPYVAVQAFFDPSVKFGLQFDNDAIDAQALDTDGAEESEHEVTALVQPKETTDARATAGKSKSQKEKPAEPEKAADVVSLDAFRKKK